MPSARGEGTDTSTSNVRVFPHRRQLRTHSKEFSLKSSRLGVCVALGAAVGGALGAGTHQAAVGLALGVAFGVAIGAILDRSRNDKK
jgi:hypothetical protein